MTRSVSILVLILAAILETGGDAIMRLGLLSPSSGKRALLFATAGLVLFAYGWTVNAPPWQFGKLLGTYVVFVFVVAQLISWLVFRQPPSRVTLIGGSVMLAGAAIISFGAR